jgi:hypothetical protein
LGGPEVRSVREREQKLRGGRRYFRKLQNWPACVVVELGGPNWYDFWHLHPDFRGWSRQSGKARRAHLVVLFRAFERVLQQVASCTEPAQVFVSINTKDSSGNAIYVHTPNPNSDKFPYQFDDYVWQGVRVPPWLVEFIDPDRHEVAETFWHGEKRYVVAPKGPRGRPTRG